MPKTSPFHSRIAALCESQSWQRWAGYLSPNNYELDHLREYYAIRASAALIDISPLYKYRISGRRAQHLLERLVTRRVARCRIDQALYTAWCDDRGKLVDDGVIVRLGEDTYRLTAADPSYSWLQDCAVGLDVTIEDVSEATAALAVQGPTSRAVLSALTGGEVDGLRSFRGTGTKLAGIPVYVSRTGYTGDLGYEIWADVEHAEALWDAVMDAGHAHNLRPVGNDAVDIARIEAGHILNAVDYCSSRATVFEVQKSTPYELGLGWTVALDKGPFIGRESLREEWARGPRWAFVGLEVEWSSLAEIFAEFGMPPQLPEKAWGGAVPILAAGSDRQVGRATSGTWSPLLKRYLALGRVEPPYAEPGTRLALEVTAEGYRRPAKAVVAELPFFDPPRKRG